MPKRSFHDMENSEKTQINSHSDAVFDTQGMIVRQTTISFPTLTGDLSPPSLVRSIQSSMHGGVRTSLIGSCSIGRNEGGGLLRPCAKNDNSPGVRHAHSATYFTMLGEAYIAVLGGSDGSTNDSNLAFADVFIYDIKQRLWLSVVPEAESQKDVEYLTPRLFHTATFVEIDHDPYLAVVGGIFNEHSSPALSHPIGTSVLPELRFFNLRLRRWSNPIYIPGRYRHAAVLIPSTREPKLMLIGGRDKKGTLSKETILINLRLAFHTLKHRLPSDKLPTEDHGAGIYWSHLAGVVQPLGPYVGSCHTTTHANSVIIFGREDRSMDDELPSSRPRNRLPRGPLRFQPEPRPRPPEPTRRSSDISQHSDQTDYSGWALTFDGGSVSYRELRRLRRMSQKAELAVKSLPIPALPSPVVPTDPAPPQNMPVTSKPEWLWSGVVKSGWGTSTGGQEDLLLLLYQANKHTFFIPVLLSALAIQKDVSNARGCGLDGLLPPLWDGFTTQTTMPLDPSEPPFGDFALRSSTPEAPPIILHRSVLLARSVYFKILLTSGFTESRKGEVEMEESYPALYALAYWIYTSGLPEWLESSSIFPHEDDTSIEARYASHAGETLCELLIAANARMVPALVVHVRQLLRSHMHVPELAPLVWRAMELTGMDQSEEVIPFSSSGSRDGLGNREWIRDVVAHQLRPTESQREFNSAVVQWCCGSDPEVRAAMESAKEWLEPEIWRSWVNKCGKSKDDGRIVSKGGANTDSEIIVKAGSDVPMERS
ncbi:BTB domain-containing protein [Rhizoctonia solani AG-1 IA]|uniref:BTB domain-containing protein n=1 Tax=Thanatephorus cucumeris (strain AG1-IA) TaxID=983506 RepID=L8WK04_THACA|nr:BTB domain-containing protein [Rhizoctonia solani AG-1 IA]